MESTLFYLAKPTYGGWVTFTAHLHKLTQSPICKVSKRTEKNKRCFGYDSQYQNVSVEDAIQAKDILITAVDKHYWDILPKFPKSTSIVIHDPTECQPNKKKPNPLVQSGEHGDPLLKTFHVITIRKSVQQYLKQVYKINAEYKPHPFYISPETSTTVGMGYPFVSIARIDFDKHTDILLQANQQLMDANKPPIYLFGSENRLYVYHKLTSLKFHDYWKGKFPKTIEPSLNGCSILKDAKYMIDMSIIKKDGGGTQYSFLEAIHGNCVLILHTEWISHPQSVFVANVNCLAVSDADQLAKILINDIDDKLYQRILKNSRKLLVQHSKVQW